MSRESIAVYSSSCLPGSCLSLTSPRRIHLCCPFIPSRILIGSLHLFVHPLPFRNNKTHPFSCVSMKGPIINDVFKYLYVWLRVHATSLPTSAFGLPPPPPPLWTSYMLPIFLPSTHFALQTWLLLAAAISTLRKSRQMSSDSPTPPAPRWSAPPADIRSR